MFILKMLRFKTDPQCWAHPVFLFQISQCLQQLNWNTQDTYFNVYFLHMKRVYKREIIVCALHIVHIYIQYYVCFAGF